MFLRSLLWWSYHFMLRRCVRDPIPISPYKDLQSWRTHEPSSSSVSTCVSTRQDPHQVTCPCKYSTHVIGHAPLVYDSQYLGYHACPSSTAKHEALYNSSVCHTRHLYMATQLYRDTRHQSHRTTS